MFPFRLEAFFTEFLSAFTTTLVPASKEPFGLITEAHKLSA